MPCWEGTRSRARQAASQCLLCQIARHTLQCCCVPGATLELMVFIKWIQQHVFCILRYWEPWRSLLADLQWHESQGCWHQYMQVSQCQANGVFLYEQSLRCECHVHLPGEADTGWTWASSVFKSFPSCQWNISISNVDSVFRNPEIIVRSCIEYTFLLQLHLLSLSLYLSIKKAVM